MSATSPAPGGGSEAMTAARHAVTLGSSLFTGFVIAILVRLLVPRVLGPDHFGELRIAESMAEMVFVILTLGVDMLIRREVAVEPGRAHGYVWSLLVVRVLLAVAVVAVVFGVLGRTGTPAGVLTLFLTIAIAQVLLVLNNSYAAFEHAGDDVRWIAGIGLAAKALWAALVLAVLWIAPSAQGVAFALLVTEAVRFTWLTVRGVNRYGAPRRVDLRLASGAIVASLPFFANFVAHNLYGRIGTWWLGASCSDLEVGWYGAAGNVAAIALLGMPLLLWVLVPSASRAGRQSDEALEGLVSGSLRVTMLVSTPVVLGLALAAPFWTDLMFGAAFRPAAPALAVLAPTFTLAYVSTVCAIDLIQRNRIRHVALVSIAGVLASVALNGLFIPWGSRALGTGGGSVGAAAAMLATEILATTAMVAIAWRPRWTVTLGRTVGGLLLGAAGSVASAVALRHHVPLAVITATTAFVASLLLTRAVVGDDLRFLYRLKRGGAHVATTG